MLSLSVPKTIKQGVGRRILAMFFLAGVLPVLFTAGLAYYEFMRNAESAASNALRTNAKTYGVDILLRLNDLSNKASNVTALVGSGESPTLESHEYLLRDFQAVWTLPAQGDGESLHGGSPLLLGQFRPDIEFLRSGKAQLNILTRAGGFDLVLLHAIDPGAEQLDLVAFQLSNTSVLGPRDNTPYNTQFCVLTVTGLPLHCTSDFSSEARDAVAGFLTRAQGIQMDWSDDGETQLSAAWQLFLTSTFGAPAVEIVAWMPRSFALQSHADFRRIFLPALALVIVLVGLLSMNAIGRSLTPLQRLTTAAGQFAAGRLDARVRLSGEDEFNELADAFNDMAGRLGQQIETLEAMSRIDRLILSGAGFGEVSETVLREIMHVMHCEAAAVIARDENSSASGRMISLYEGKCHEEEIRLPSEIDKGWYQPRQVALVEVAEEVAPYKSRFLEYGQEYVVIVPVVLSDDLKGILLIGASSKLNMGPTGLSRCADLAGRYAVALSSVEREDALYRQAHYDELTGLPNRQLMKERLADIIDATRMELQTGALLYLDLDRFKEINDVYGHSVGDLVLTQAAERIVSVVRDSDFVARLGGDEFVVVMPRVYGSERTKATAGRILSRLGEVFSVFGINHFVGASIGIVMFPGDGESVETLLKNADAAMYRAKEQGRQRFEFFNAELNSESRRKIELERDLRNAHESDQLEVYYQPQFDMSTGVISGAEALLRWRHSQHGFVSPREFVPLAEDTELIVEIGRWVVEQACRDLRGILDEQLHPGAVSINVSARQLGNSAFVQDVLTSLERHNIHPGYMLLEVTETTVAQNRDKAIDILKEFRANGVRVAIDDFGTGYSSLSYLQNMPFDFIKIDKSFVDLIGQSGSSDNICRTIITMAHELKKVAIAEGVETREQVRFLTENQCDIVQGFHYAHPLPVSEFLDFIRKQDFHTQRRKALELI